jgi:ADP-heptose:LPS heptosyltransferase
MSNLALQLPQPKPDLRITGMWGLGDNLHQRACLRILAEQHSIWLETPYAWLYHDLNLRLMPRPTNLWAQQRNLERERAKFTKEQPPLGCPHWKIWYLKPAIDRYGSILGAMCASFFMPGLERPDFSLPVKDEWRQAAFDLMAQWPIHGRPILIYRPIVLRREWNSANRNPDPAAYAELFAAIRRKFFVVSIASLRPNTEWIVGPEQDVDVKIHNGMPVETMCGLFAEADIVFANAGFAPVMAQAVGTPSIVVYGGRESFRTSNAAGAHLAPTLGIDKDQPCDCHREGCGCAKTISIAPARERILEFVRNAGY